MKFRRNGVQLLQPGSSITSQENFPMRKHASDVNVSTNGNYPSDCRVINERSVSQAGSRLASPGISRANSRASSPGGGRRVTICEVVRKYSHSTSDINMIWDDNDNSLPVKSISYKVDSEARSSSGASSNSSGSHSSTSSLIDNSSSEDSSSPKSSPSFISHKSNSLSSSTGKSIERSIQSSESIKMKTPVQSRRFQVNKSTKMFLALPDQTQEVQRPYMAVAGNKQTSPGLKKLAEAIKIEISPPEEEENQDIEASNNNQTDFVCHNEKRETPKETKTTSPPKQVTDKVTEKEKIYLDLPGAKPKKKNRFNVVKVESCEDGKTNLDLNHLSVDSPDIKGYPHDESPGGSIKAGSEVDFEIDREDEKFASLRRTYSRSSIASAVANFKDQIKGTLAGDMAKGKADANTRLKIAVLIFFSICFGIVVTSHILYSQQVGEVQLFSNMKLLEEKRRIVIDIPGNSGLAADLGVNIPYHLHPYDCLPGVHHNETENEKCAEWKGKARLIIKRFESKEVEDLTCYSLHWQALNDKISPQDCWAPDLEGNWYGGGERLHQSWPLEKSTVELSPFVTGDEDQTEWGNVIKRYFINSQGVSIKVSDETPLSVSMSPESGLCLKAHYDEFPYYYHKEGYPQLNYTVCSNENLLTLYEKQLTRSFWDGHKESDLKELNRLLKLPLWQLPAPQNGEPLNSEHVSNYIKMIVGRSAPVSRGEPRGYLLIDSSWQQNMGDLVLSDRLRDLEKTVSGYGLTLVLTLTPFVSTDSISFNEGVEKGLFVMERKLNITRDIPALTWYKNVPAAALLDITNNNTKSWLKGKLREVVKAMPSVVFFVETGNAFHTPHYFEFQTDLYNPDLYKDLLISVAMTEIKVVGVSGASARRPKAPAFVHLTPLASNWDSLRTIIPNILNLGVIGYPFVSAGPVGGDFTKNGTIQTSRTSSNEEVPDPELFIRWWQLATFMPQVHFTTPPTQYRNKHIHTVTQNLKYIKEEVVNPELIMFSQVAMENSAPVIRPLWMLDPEDEVAQTISDEFLIGDKILVAPVLEQGATTRNVYLPHSKKGPGVWKRGSDGTFFEGGQWLNNSLAPLDTVLYFIRQSDFARPGSDLS